MYSFHFIYWKVQSIPDRSLSPLSGKEGVGDNIKTTDDKRHTTTHNSRSLDQQPLDPAWLWGFGDLDVIYYPLENHFYFDLCRSTLHKLHGQTEYWVRSTCCKSGGAWSRDNTKEEIVYINSSQRNQVWGKLLLLIEFMYYPTYLLYFSVVTYWCSVQCQLWDELGWKKNVYKLYMYFYLCCANLQWVHGYIRTNKLYFLLYCIPYTIANLPVYGTYSMFVQHTIDYFPVHC